MSLGAIIGGVIGGLALVLAFIVALVYIIKNSTIAIKRKQAPISEGIPIPEAVGVQAYKGGGGGKGIEAADSPAEAVQTHKGGEQEKN